MTFFLIFLRYSLQSLPSILRKKTNKKLVFSLLCVQTSFQRFSVRALIGRLPFWQTSPPMLSSNMSFCNLFPYRGSSLISFVFPKISSASQNFKLFSWLTKCSSQSLCRQFCNMYMHLQRQGHSLFWIVVFFLQASAYQKGVYYKITYLVLLLS